MAEPESFGQRLRRLRRAAGLTQQALADRAHVARRSINDFEYDRRDRPHGATITALFDALDLHAEERAALQQLLNGATPTGEVAWREALGLPPYELVGRAADLAALRALAWPDEGREPPSGDALAPLRPRLITLMGPAGVGKTHLALQLAADLASHYRDGVFRVDLTGLPSHQDISRAIARAVGLAVRSGMVPLDPLCGAIGTRQLLVVLDGCEDLLDPVAEVVTSLLRRCPSLRFVIPCREPLEADGESIWRVERFERSLPTALPALRQHPAVRLMATRAATGFAVIGETRGTIEALCHRSGGLPLALTLLAGHAAARPSASPGIGADLSQGEESVADLIAWAYRQLVPEAQRVLRLLTPFAASWPREAIAFVAPQSIGGRQPDPLLLLERAGMIQPEGQASSRRYRLLPAIHSYALDELRAAGEEAQARSAHLDWCLKLAREAAHLCGGSRRQHDRPGALAHADHDLAQALLWALDHDRARGRQLARFLRLALRERHGDETSWARLLPHLER